MRSGVRAKVKGDIDEVEWRLTLDCHQIERGLRNEERERERERERESFLEEE